MVAAALAAYTLAAFALFSSTWIRPTAATIGIFGDPHLVIWFLGWTPFAIQHGMNPLYTNYLDYPDGANMMWNPSMPLVGVLLAPLTQLGQLVLAYNLLMTAALSLSAWTAFLFIRRYVASDLAAFAGGAVYGFSPFMTAQSLAHPYMTVAFLPPLFLLLIDDLARLQRRRWAVSGLWLGLAAAAQLYIGEEMLAITAVVSLLLLCIAAGLRADVVRSKARHAILGFGAGAVVFSILAGPAIAYQLFGPQHVHAAIHPPGGYVSDALSFLAPTKHFLFAPDLAVRITSRFTGNTVEDNSYIGLLLALLLLFIAVRYWRRFEVRTAALGAVVIAILSMGVTIHVAGKLTPVPVFALGLVFLLFRRHLPSFLMVGVVLLGWVVLNAVPVLDNLLPNRLMIYFFLLVGLLVAVWLDDMRSWNPTPRRMGWVALGVSMALLIPAVPFPSTPDEVPAFFTAGAASRIPEGSVALVVPLSIRNDARAQIWQERAGFRFRMPEGYANIPDALPRGARMGPPDSATQTQSLAVANGRPTTLDDATRLQILSELARWQVQTVIVGPMNNEKGEVDLFSYVLGRAPEPVDGVYVWWDVGSESALTPSAAPRPGGPFPAPY